MAFRSSLGGANVEFAAIRAVLMIGIFTAAIASFLFHNPQSLPPARSLAGCYAANDGPAIMLSSDRLAIGQRGFPTLKFRIEWTKDIPFVIVTEPLIGLTEQADGSLVFSTSANRSSVFYPGHLVDGKVFGVASLGDREFIVAADNGSKLHIFKPVEASVCRGM